MLRPVVAAAAISVLLQNPTAAEPPLTVASAKNRCCLSKKGPEPVPYSGKWLAGTFTRAECVAKAYGFWDGDEPSDARKVCSIKRDWPRNDPVDPVPPPNRSNPDVKFYDQEKFTIEYDVSGSAESGSITEHVTNWGNKRVEVRDVTFSYGPVKQVNRQRIIYDGASIITIDGATGRTTKVVNPLFDKIVVSMKGKSGVEYGKAWATSMGAVPTGKTNNFAGHDCDEWRVASLGTTICVTAAGLTLFSSTKTGPVAMTRKARVVKMGDGGPASAYAYDEANVEAAPSLQDVLKKARRGKP